MPASKDGSRPSFIMFYNPPGEWEEWKNQVSAAIRKAMGPLKIKDMLKPDDPVRAELIFVMTKTSARIDDVHHGIKPDLDNLVKLVMDAATESKVFHDDSRVSIINTCKRYPLTKDEPIGVHITIEKAPGQSDLPLPAMPDTQAGAEAYGEKH